MPVYNVESYLEVCLRSVLLQDMAGIEIICIDDGSTDGSIELLKEFASRFPSIIVITHNTNLGLPSARNTGIEYSRGDYLFFLDSDDFIAPFCLSSLYQIASTDEVDITAGGVLKCSDSNGAVNTGTHGHLLSNVYRRTTVFEEPCLLASVISVNKLIRRDFIESTGLYFPRTPKRFEDMLTYKWLLEGATFSALNEITYFYRQRNNSPTRQSITQELTLKALSDRIVAFRLLMEYILEKGLVGSIYDPLSSSFSNTQLKPAVNWIIPAAVDLVRDDVYGNCGRSFFEELKSLALIVPEKYRSELDPRIARIFGELINSDIEKAIRDSLNFFETTK